MKHINSLSDIQGLSEKIVYAIHSAVLIIDRNKQILYASDNIENIFNASIENLLNKISCNAFDCINRKTQNCPDCKLHKAIRKLIEYNEPTKREEIEFKFYNTETKDLEFSVLDIVYKSEKMILLIFDDISEKKALYKSLETKSLQLRDKLDETIIQNEKLKLLTESLEEADTVIMTIANAIEAKDIVTQGHTQRVAFYSQKIGEKIGLSKEDLEILRKGCILHDVGKMGIPDYILKKPDRLTIEEFEIMKQHPAKGEDILKPLKSFDQVSRLVRHHHEKLDGTGYPDGLKAEEIDILVRITAIVDIYDALTMDRPYRKKMPREKAVAILKDGAARGWWDPDIIDVMDTVSKEHWNLFNL